MLWSVSVFIRTFIPTLYSCVQCVQYITVRIITQKPEPVHSGRTIYHH